MSGRSLSHSVLTIASTSESAARRAQKSSPKLSKTFRLSSSARLPNSVLSHSFSSATASSSNPTNFAWETQLTELRDSLSNDASPTRVWSNYTGLLNFFGFERVPPELHQLVLRRCTPTAQQLRISAARRLFVGNKPDSPHIHEGRFQTIIRNIHASGAAPELDDYHFILNQFAAVGHHVGSMQVYKELTHVGVTPTAKTIGLCFQAIAHRFTLPIYKQSRPRLVEQTQKMFADLMADMRRYEIPLVSANIDLAIRVLKETVDHEGFESLMRWAYGIDLSNPDRPPLEIMERNQLSAGPLQQPLSFSTAALNTTIDILGRLGDVSKLVQAFEVLTTPLPHANEHFFSSFEDEDDFGVKVDISIPFTPPYASPNTTTYNFLLRHLCRLGQATLARHYINQAMRLERKVAIELHQQIAKRTPLDRIPAPHFSINRGTLLSVLGESNRDKNLGLMRWLSTKMARIIRKKKRYLDFYTSLRDKLANTQRIQQVDPPRSARLFDNSKATQPSSSLPFNRKKRPEPTSVFDVDLDSTGSSPPTPFKTLDINVHISVLQRDVVELEFFNLHLIDILGRTTQRVKERLGRRVWSNKSIYLSTTKQRMIVSKSQWRDIVGFKARHPTTSTGTPTTHLRSDSRKSNRTVDIVRHGHQRSFSTVFAGSYYSSDCPQSLTCKTLWRSPFS